MLIQNLISIFFSDRVKGELLACLGSLPARVASPYRCPPRDTGWQSISVLNIPQIPGRPPLVRAEPEEAPRIGG